MFQLNGLVALITGASGGLGQTMARFLHQQGAEVILSGTREDALNSLAQELQERVYVLPCNLMDAQSTENLIPQAEALAGKIDILVNNAGITRDGLAMRMKDEDWQTVLDINLTSVFRLCRGVMRGMMKRRFGRIINITSIVGVTGNTGQANYAAAKAGLIGLTKSLALELASRNITVNCIAPGFIETAMTNILNESVKEQMLKNIPQGQIGTPEDIAAAVVYLGSKEASYITGQTLHINGGMYLT